jgi:hypothetical protein
MRLAMRHLTDRVLVNLIEDDDRSGWHFGSWFARDSLIHLPIQPAEEDREIHFDDVDTAVAYFQSHYRQRLAQHVRGEASRSGRSMR